MQHVHTLPRIRRYFSIQETMELLVVRIYGVKAVDSKTATNAQSRNCAVHRRQYDAKMRPLQDEAESADARFWKQQEAKEKATASNFVIYIPHH